MSPKKKQLVLVLGLVILVTLLLSIFSRDVENWANGFGSVPYPKFPFKATYINSKGIERIIKSNGKGKVSSSTKDLCNVEDYNSNTSFLMNVKKKAYSRQGINFAFPNAIYYEEVFKKAYQKVLPQGENAVGGENCRGWRTDGYRNSIIDNLLAMAGYRAVLPECAEDAWFDTKTGILVKRTIGKATKSENIERLKEYSDAPVVEDDFIVPGDFREVEIVLP